MVAISSAGSAARYGVQQAAVPQVRRAAEQAQRTADALQTQAREAWQQVDSAEANARAIDTRANQALSTAAQARQNFQSFGAQIKDSGAASPADAEANGSTSSKSSSAPVLSSSSPYQLPSIFNSQSQRIGMIVNITA